MINAEKIQHWDEDATVIFEVNFHTRGWHDWASPSEGTSEIVLREIIAREEDGDVILRARPDLYGDQWWWKKLASPMQRIIERIESTMVRGEIP